jgi:hypothetical protein
LRRTFLLHTPLDTSLVFCGYFRKKHPVVARAARSSRTWHRLWHKEWTLAGQKIRLQRPPPHARANGAHGHKIRWRDAKNDSCDCDQPHAENRHNQIGKSRKAIIEKRTRQISNRTKAIASLALVSRSTEVAARYCVSPPGSLTRWENASPSLCHGSPSHELVETY